MRTATLKLLVAIVSIPAFALLTGITGNGVFLFGSLIALLLSILWGLDLARQLRVATPGGRPQRTSLILPIAQALLGLTSLAIGLAIIGWILFNLLIATQPQFVFNLVALPVPIALVLAGATWLKGAFRSS